MGEINDQLRKFVEEHSTPNHFKSKAEIVEYFRDKYGTKWTPHAAMFISQTTDKKSKAYGAAIRDFQGKRLDKPGLPGRYEEIGKRLPPISRTPKGDITVTVKGKQDIYVKGKYAGQRDKKITVTFTGADAYNFVNNPSLAMIYDAYMSGGADLFERGDYAIYAISIQ